MRRLFSYLTLVLFLAVLGAGESALGAKKSKSKAKTPLGYLTDDEISRLLMSRGLDPRDVVRPWGLTQEMAAWAWETIAKAPGGVSRLEALQRRLLDPEEMGVLYEWGYTGTATEVFSTRRANCLAFTNLFVGMARDVGMPVYFVAVHDVESFRRSEDLVVISDHIAVGFGPFSDRVIFDFSETPQDDYRVFQKISDLTAVAMFHSNRGAEALQFGMPEAAVEWLETAVKIDPDLASSWVNLGVARRRLDDLAGAEEAYRRALVVNPRVFPAYGNLATLLRLQDRDEEARGYEEILASSPSRNPFTYVSLGDVSLAAGRLDEADKLYRKAARLDAESAEAWAALGLLDLRRNDERAARRMLEKAQKIGPEHPRTRRLRAALAKDG